MGTRADFYVGRGDTAEWIGSITWDGYPHGIDTAVFEASTEDGYRTAVTEFFAPRKDVTMPNEPWPWPWENSQTTDYAYAFDGGAVHASCFGSAWFTVDPEAEAYGEPEDDDGAKVPFPDMSSRKGDWNHIMSRSGLITVSLPEHEK
jgi:hypothetical protein